MTINIRKWFSLLWAIVLFSGDAVSQSSPFRFDRITVEDGLSSDVVNCILQDRYGFMWIGTQDGLNRYDGKAIKLYRSIGNDSTSLRSNWITGLAEDRNGNLWILANGLQRYDRERDNFVCYPADPNGESGPHATPYVFAYDTCDVFWLGSTNGVEKFDIGKKKFTEIDLEGHAKRPVFLKIDKKGNIWTGGYNTREVVRLDPRTLEYVVFSQPSPHEGTAERPIGLPVHQINSMYVDEQDTLWILSSRGVWKFDWRNNSKTFCFDTSDVYYAVEMIVDNLGRTWIATYNQGIRLVNWETRTFSSFRYNSADPQSPNSSTINTAYVDRAGNVWFGTNRGVAVLKRWKKAFLHFSNNTEIANSLLEGEVSAVAEDNNGRLWIAIMGKGISRMERATGQFKNYQVPSPWIKSLVVDQAGNILVGSFAPVVYDDTNDRFKPLLWFPSIPDKRQIPGSQRPPDAYVREEDGTQWFGFFDGIIRINSDGTVKKWTTADSASGLEGINTPAIYRDRFGTIWVASPALHRFDPNRERFVPIHTSMIRNQVVRAMHEDKMGNFWVGMGIGLALYDQQGDSIKAFFDRTSGLGGQKVFGILEGDHDDLWVITEDAIAKVHIKSLAVRSYGLNHGVPVLAHSAEYSFGNRSHVRLKDGTMIVGRGSNGFVMFHPDSIRENPETPPIYITGLTVSNEPVQIHKGFILSKNIVFAESITLSYDQNDFSFQYAALDYTIPKMNQYKYRLEGIEEEWIEAGNRTTAYYTHIDPGEYRFHVIGSNSDGIWNEEGASITVIVTPPWWQTWWAYGGYGLAIFGLLVGLRRYELNRQRLKHQAELEHLEKKKLLELDRAKSTFFANITHEFRTPLTLIEGPARQIQSGDDRVDAKENASIIVRNARQLLRLVNQLLDLSKIESHNMGLQVCQTRIPEFFRGIAVAFESLATLKDIDYVVSVPDSMCVGFVDRDAMEKILKNLLSNAFKFTGPGGEVRLEVLCGDSWLTVRIMDTGIGIPANEQEKIFDRFYQVERKSTQFYEGTGIGLALVMELVKLHRGTISVESEPGSGSTFSVRVAIGSDAYRPGEIVEIPNGEAAGTTDIAEDIPGPSDVIESEEKENRPRVLVIEDNQDMRQYIQSHLRTHFSISEAGDGIEGLEAATTTIPDLIVSDVMMPRMDGFEMCRQLKTDNRTSHIPVILLTAKADQEHKVEGLETGADDYLAKPFDGKELIARMHNLIQLRETLRKSLQNELTIKPGRVPVCSMDEKFLKKVFDAVESHMADADWDSSALADIVAMSRMNLHRKIKAMTGYSTGELIRHIRLEKAAELLKKKAGTVSEVAYGVGFNNLSHFARMFRVKFGCNPSEYADLQT